jgi:hypothetical protein
VGPDAGDYHIGPGSAAIDRGVNAGIITDIDADEYMLGGAMTYPSMVIAPDDMLRYQWQAYRRRQLITCVRR